MFKNYNSSYKLDFLITVWHIKELTMAYAKTTSYNTVKHFNVICTEIKHTNEHCETV